MATVRRSISGNRAPQKKWCVQNFKFDFFLVSHCFSADCFAVPHDWVFSFRQNCCVESRKLRTIRVLFDAVNKIVDFFFLLSILGAKQKVFGILFFFFSDSSSPSIYSIRRYVCVWHNNDEWNEKKFDNNKNDTRDRNISRLSAIIHIQAIIMPISNKQTNIM